MDLFWAEEAVSEFLKVPRRDRLAFAVYVLLDNRNK